MSTETIEAIGDLWSLALVVLLILFIVLFRKELKTVLLSMEQFSWGNKKLKLRNQAVQEEHPSGEEKKDTTPEPPPEKEDPVELPREESARTIVEEEPATDPELRMIAAFQKGEIEEAERLFKTLQKSIEVSAERLANEAFYLYLRYEHANDTSALSKLYELAKQEEITGYAYRVIALCHGRAGQFDKSASAYKISAELAKSEDHRAELSVSAANAFFKAGQSEDAFEELVNQLQNVSDTDAVARVYEGLASIYALTGDREFESLALEKVLELKPNDADVRFKVAYSYGQQEGLDVLSLQHYKTLLQFRHEDGTTLNNLAVQYQRLKMPLRGVNYYERSSNFDETLAMANLAILLLGVGFEKEAREMIARAQEKDDVHPNVARALSSISVRKETESEIEKTSLESAREIQKFQLSFAEAYFSKADCPDLTGVWKFSDMEAEVKITHDDAQFQATYDSFLWAMQINGQLTNRAAKIIFYTKQYDIATRKSELKEDHPGKLYFSVETGELIILRLAKHKFTVTKLTRQ